ncbi:MAG: hypothetical protein AAFX62_07485, partial [Pseudomonadota bacterium]
GAGRIRDPESSLGGADLLLRRDRPVACRGEPAEGRFNAIFRATFRCDIASECRTEYRIEAALCRLAAARDRALAAEEQIRSAEAALGLSDPAGPVPRLEIRPLPGGRFEVDVLIDGILPY